MGLRFTRRRPPDPRQDIEYDEHEQAVTLNTTRSVEEVVAMHGAPVDTLANTLGLEQHLHDHVLMPAVHMAAERYHLLPPMDRSRGATMFGVALEEARRTVRVSDAWIPTPEWLGESRHTLDIRWRIAMCMAGLLSVAQDLSRYATDLRGIAWDSWNDPIGPWARARGLRRCRLRIRPASQRYPDAAIRLHAAMRWLPDATEQFILQPGRELAHLCLVEALASTDARPNPVRRFLRGEDADSPVPVTAASPATTPPAPYGQEAVTAQRPDYDAGRILAAMIELVATGQWPVGGESATVWATQQRCYILWPPAARTLSEHIRRTDPRFINDAEAIAGVLIRAGIAIPNPSAGTAAPPWLWRITVNGARKKIKTLAVETGRLFPATRPVAFDRVDVVEAVSRQGPAPVENFPVESGP